MLADKIKAGRLRRGLSQQEFAEALSVVRQTVSKWEKGLSVPDSDMLIKISKVLGISVSDLLYDGENTENEDENTPENKGAKRKKSTSPLSLFLIILGAPLWLPLLIAAAAVLISLLASLWAVIISFWAVFAAFVCAALGLTVGGAVLCFEARGAGGIFLIGAALFLAGLSIFAFFGCKALTKCGARLTALPIRLIKKAVKRGGGDE